MPMKNSRRSSGRLLLLGGLFLLASCLLSLALGSSRIPLSQILRILTGGEGEGADALIFRHVRLPRTLGCLVCGATLSVSGAVIQGVLANRLAAPGIIGVNAGAALAVTLCAAAGFSGLWTPLWAFAGAFAAVLTLALGARAWGASRGTVLLMGVALNSLLNALSDTVITFRPELAALRHDFKVGDLAALRPATLLPAGLLAAVALLILFTLYNELDLLNLGEEGARALGMDTLRVRLMFLFLAALLSGCAVSLAGLLSFVGLIVPHTVRRLKGRSPGSFLPLCALFGAGFLTLCDTLARTLFSPYELPAGILMAYLGVPFFLFLLVRTKGGHARDRA